MKCPVCDVTLSISAREGVEIDFCPQCRGVWLDRGELDKILDRVSRGPETVAPPPPPPPPSPENTDYRTPRDRDYPSGRRDEGRRDERDRDRDDDRDRYYRNDRDRDRDRDRRDDRSYDRDRGYDKRKRRKSFLEEIFDFD